MNFLLRRATLLALLAWGGALSQSVDDSVYTTGEVSYGTYFNGRFGFAVAVPLGYLQPQGGLTDGNGQVFSSPDGAQMRVFGSRLLLERDLTEAYEVLSQDGPNRQVTYKVQRDDWFVVSGFTGAAGDTVFYTKVMEHPESGAYLSLTLQYARDLKPTFDPITEEVVRSFRALEGGGSG